jgi:hypothetical protein
VHTTAEIFADALQPKNGATKISGLKLRTRSKLNSQNWRSDLGWIWTLRLSKAAGIASYFEANFIRSGAE